MKLLFALIIIFRFTSAFGDAARYERVFYYYAYLIDAAVNEPNGPQTIAASCVAAAGTSPSDGWEVTTDQYPDGATLEGDHGLSGLYQTSRIGVNVNNVATLINETVQFVKINIGSLPAGTATDTIKTNIFKQIVGIARTRMENKVNDLINDFGGDGKGGYT
ncbi:uncharacterized protein PAC_12005 [Phialocephala subalpina]|uniref:Uncharacterized protein n=1 Tax=Phialocephala subalpina TaxID=576137 RepID=A0A1L7XAP5_9HELO|nr:uncharacterized protein PAC_12005 [Phialocephala subalpina]